MAPRGSKVLVNLGPFKRKKPPGTGGRGSTITEQVIVRMFGDAIQRLNFASKIIEKPEGKEVTSKNNNGTYKTEKYGSDGQQPIIVYLNEFTDKGRYKTIHFRVPYWYPNFKLRKLLEGNNQVHGFKRNGRKVQTGVPRRRTRGLLPRT